MLQDINGGFVAVMRKFTNFLYTFGENAIKYLFLLLMGVLSVAAVVFTESANNMAEQKMIISIDKMYITVPLAFLLAALCMLVGNIIEKKSKRSVIVLVTGVCVWYFIVGMIFILRARSAPSADPMTVYYMADMTSRGDLSFVDYTGSYLSYYPQQIGLTSFLAGILWIFHKLPLPFAEYHFIKIIYLMMICGATVAQNRIVKRLWKSDYVSAVFLVMSALNLPYIMYSTYIYSEIPAYCFFSVGACFLNEILTENRNDDEKVTEGGKSSKDTKINRTGIKQIIYAVASIVMFTAAVFIRKNTLVMMIAVAIVVVFRLIKSLRWEWLAYVLVCMACCVFVLPTVTKVYENASGSRINTGVTAKSYFAMGMQEGGRGPGWYNGYNFDTFEDAGQNSELADEISEKAISERLEYFGDHPWYTVSFYARKISTQWLDGTYASLQATHATMSERSEFFNEVYEGKYNVIYNVYCDALQTLIYVCAFLCALALVIKKEKNIFWKYFFAICVLGGFFFHILWEGNSRYIVTYSLLIIPYSAQGLAVAKNKVSEKKLIKVTQS